MDDQSYNSGHGHAYHTIGVDPDAITVVVVRPDQCQFIANAWHCPWDLADIYHRYLEHCSGTGHGDASHFLQRLPDSMSLLNLARSSHANSEEYVKSTTNTLE